MVILIAGYRHSCNKRKYADQCAGTDVLEDKDAILAIYNGKKD